MRAASAHRDYRLDPADPWVTRKSPQCKHLLVRAYALRFRRDLDLLGGPHWPDEMDDHHRAFIFMDGNRRAIGCAVFVQEKYSNAPHTWLLAWVYVVPSMRRQGVLRRHWPIFREAFGEFLIDPPLSLAMAAFARKYAAPVQRPHPSWLEPQKEDA